MPLQSRAAGGEKPPGHRILSSALWSQGQGRCGHAGHRGRRVVLHTRVQRARFAPRSVGGQARFGPDLEWLPEGADPAALDYRVNPRRAAAFAVAVRRYGPGLPEGALRPAYSGVRPKIHGPEEPAPDFRIDGPAVDGVHGLVNLLGIESPGLTVSLAIAEHVAGLLDG